MATVGISVSIRGEIKAAEDLMVDGQVEGRIELPEHTLTIGPNATVVADVLAKVVIVFGSITGSVTAREKADVRQTASIDGSITCNRLSVQDGATIKGSIATKHERSSISGASTRAA